MSGASVPQIARADHVAAGLAGGARIAPDPVRALESNRSRCRLCSGSGRYSRLTIVDLPAIHQYPSQIGLAAAMR